MKKKSIIITLAIVVLLGAGVYVLAAVGGKKSVSVIPSAAGNYGRHLNASSTGAYRGRMGNFQSGGFVGGTVTAENGDMLTIDQRDGTTKTISVTSSTKIELFNSSSSAPAAGSFGDIKAGDKITAVGTTTAAGVWEAETVMKRQ